MPFYTIFSLRHRGMAEKAPAGVSKEEEKYTSTNNKTLTLAI